MLLRKFLQQPVLYLLMSFHIVLPNKCFGRRVRGSAKGHPFPRDKTRMISRGAGTQIIHFSAAGRRNSSLVLRFMAIVPRSEYSAQMSDLRSSIQTSFNDEVRMNVLTTPLTTKSSI
uniref:Uncharacterized protein n=1 Tax=Physcomitrium patens TaxID=3218 RepID=A0A2K1KNG8_PHYPA|nr:hypothetical protein PHYPA_006221 [Physcomitrium patens]